MGSTEYQATDATRTRPERRQSPRFTAQVQIELRRDGNNVPLRLQTTDLSRGGCYVQLVTPLPIGTYVDATLWLDQSPVRIRSRVVTRHPQFGNGIMFLEFHDCAESLLWRYLDAIAV